MKYLLDTCVISDFIKSDINTHEKIKSCAPKDLAISTISIMEIQFGLSLNIERSKKIKPAIESFLSVINILDFDESAAAETAYIRAYLKSKGKTIGFYDSLIAGTALANELTLASSNLSEFNRVPHLIVENWRAKNI